MDLDCKTRTMSRLFLHCLTNAPKQKREGISPLSFVLTTTSNCPVSVNSSVYFEIIMCVEYLTILGKAYMIDHI